MLPKDCRFPLRTGFLRIKKEGKIFQNPLFGLIVSTNPTKERSRFAFIVSKKISHKAVERNRIRRMLCEQLKELLLAIKPGYDVVFLAKKNLCGKTSADIKRELEIVLDKVGMLEK